MVGLGNRRSKARNGQNEFLEDSSYMENGSAMYDHAQSSSKASYYSNRQTNKQNHRVHFEQQPQVKEKDRLVEITNSRVHRVRDGYPKRKGKAAKLLLLKRQRDIGFGFSIRGGVEHGTGIFVSNIHKYSDAYNQGLQVGDQILRANNELFEGILHEEAAQYIQRQDILRLIVLSLGVVPGNKIALTEYQWMDCYGRPCSPLRTSGEESRRSNDSGTASRRLLAAEDERKVNLVVGNSATLGLLIRGGSEYGLGIFVVGIDQDSVADRTGIMVGEQILEINGIDFVNITHADAAEIIRSSNMMTMVLKDVGKIPIARIIYDKTEWIQKEHLIQREARNKQKQKDLILQQGLRGRLLSHQALASPLSFQWVEEKAHNKLNKDDWATLKYYIREYVRDNLSVNELGLSLLDLFDTDEKLTLLEEVRGIVRPQDIEMFDELMLSMEVAVMKNRSASTSSGKTTVVVDISPQISRHNNRNNEIQYPKNGGNEEIEEFVPDDTTNDFRDFNYRMLQEESYHSHANNMTEDTDLSNSLTQAGPSFGNPKNNLIIDEPISYEKLETVVEAEEEPIYAQVNKNILTQYSERSPPMELKTFQSPPLERHVYASPPEGGRKVFKSPPPPTATEEITAEEENYGINKLGFAFSFLNSQENSPQTPKKESPRSIVSDINSPHTVPSKRIYRDLSKNHEEENEQLDSVDNIPKQSNFQNFQPKSMMTSQMNRPSLNHIDYSSVENENIEKDIQNKKNSVGKIKIIAGSEYSQHHGGGSESLPSPTNQFDVTKTLEKHYSNFSVNDIIRQNFLPTTRVENESSEIEKNEVQDVLNNMQQNQLNNDCNRKTSLTRLNKINIQNQYQYQEKSQLQSLTQTTEENKSSTDDTKSYGKPIISPRPTIDGPQSLVPQLQNPSLTTISEDTRRKEPITQTRLTRLKSKDGTNMPDIKWFSIDRLKKTKHGSELLGREEPKHQNEAENHTEENEYFKPSELLGKMSLSIERINTIEELHPMNESDTPKPNNKPKHSEVNASNHTKSFVKEISPRFTSPRDNSLNSSVELNIIASSHSQTDSNVSTLRRKYNDSINQNNRKSPRVANNISESNASISRKNSEDSINQNTRASPRENKESPREVTAESNVSTLRKKINNSIKQNTRKSPRDENENKDDKTIMQTWVKNADLRPKTSNHAKYKTVDETTPNNLRSMIDVFSQPQADPMAAFHNYRQKKKKESLVPRSIKLPTHTGGEDPGFTVDVQTNEKGENEIVVSEITNKSMSLIEVGDTILGIGNHNFKAGIKTGLANLIIRNKFNSAEDDHVTLLLK